jgi:hypothetical protein
MTEPDDAAVPAPSYLPPNPSVGELVTEIDRARHEAARTLSALVRKFDKPALRAPLVLARPLGTVARRTPRMPLPVWIFGALLLLRWWRRRRRATRRG